jgi:hypothetical protein
MFPLFVSLIISVWLDCAVENSAVKEVWWLLLKEGSLGILERCAMSEGLSSCLCFFARFVDCPFTLFYVQVSIGWPVKLWTNTTLQDVSLGHRCRRDTRACPPDSNQRIHTRLLDVELHIALWSPSCELRPGLPSPLAVGSGRDNSGGNSAPGCHVNVSAQICIRSGCASGVQSMASAEWDELFRNTMTVMAESCAIVLRKPLKNSNSGEAGHDT